MSGPPPSFRLSLLGQWRPVDLADPFPADQQAAVREELRAAGLLPTSWPPGAEPLLAAILNADAGSEDHPEPILVSMLVHGHSGAVPMQMTRAGGVVPDRRIRVRELPWPDSQVGSIKLHEVMYTIPCPDTSTYVTVAFCSPNLPHIDELEWLYETMIGTAAWVDSTVAS